ncbi:Type I site-specific deoxyribonuclease, HsdR family [Pseudodesulfovibrio profundus]|uniref:Type I restriction enzyme endonuclease subunit n=1 Tax=Pseudodesulfovibrio profundus TaxID=57320 RepID=A0A2C8FDJ1_9BACT|nr:HsdR family type I site-specific deoxyribonuclease [Pseudodesulfovibrio profundus]SOB60493.1 Type I site-specific deoxyribonuclease, HsdR family [Pseudodesulfovibrio profundus]
MHQTPETREEYSAKIPALQILTNLGWTYVSPTECMSKRGSNREVLLKDELVRFLQARQFDWNGERHHLSPNAIEQIIRELSSPGLNEGLLTANERIYDKLTLGITVKEFINGKAVQPTIPIIDWNNPENNLFTVTEEMEVISSGGTHKRIPDLVCFVNGIPLVVIEAKRPESGNPNKSMLDEGVSQSIRNQKKDEIPQLFCYAQLLLAISNTEGRYGTTMTPKKFWATWREEELDDAVFHEVKNTPLSDVAKDAIFTDRPAKMRIYFESLWSQDVLPTDQDRLLISLLKKDRLLEMIKYFIIFDKRVGKIVARYQQAFGIKSMLERVKELDDKGGREGGVIWHTTGSGKSFTMVFLSKALLLEPELRDCRVIIVTDRVDLEKQLSKTFLSGGAYGSAVAAKKEGAKAKVRSGRDLAKRIGKGTDRIIFTIIDKFSTASKLSECYNPSDKIIVLIDEGHRSTGGETFERMRTVLPNASYIAFTGTPLLKGDKTENKFGRIIHSYTMQRAVEDGTVTPLLYEERRPELDVNESAIDNWFEKITARLTDEQRTDLKKKFANKGAVYGSENRIELIAWDIATHFADNIKALGMGLKGQLATDSKLSAIRFKKYLDETGLVSSAVIISPPDTREGHSDVNESNLPEIQQWFKDTVGNAANAEQYERETIEAFGTDEGVDILIVVDKLLTGFDEPKNTVLYIDKPLKEHNLLQAIARVNRLHEAKDFGLLIDYRGILKELDTTLKQYQDLQERTQGGFDVDDIDGLYQQVGTEYKKLPMLNERLWGIFKDVQNKQDLEQYRQVLIPQFIEEEDGVTTDTRQKVREDFYQALTEYGLCLKVALASRSFYEDGSFSEKDISRYKADLRFFTNLRKIVRQDAQETVDYSAYEEQIRRLVDKHVVGDSIQESEGVILVDDMSKDDDPKNWTKEKTRNETDIIRTRVKKTIEQELGDDPYAQKVFSELLREAIAQAEKMFDHPNKQFELFEEFEAQVKRRSGLGIPKELDESETAKAYYGTFRLILGEDHFQTIELEEEQKLIEEAITIDSIVGNAVAEHSLNPQSMESSIKAGILPSLFKLIGLDKAKDVIEHIIQITRVRLSNGNR